MGALTTAIVIGAAGAAKGIARKNQLDLQAQQNELDAERADEFAAEIAKASEDKMATYSEQVRKFAAASEAAIARKNIDLGSGLADAVRAENERVASLDLLSIQNNTMNQVLQMKYKSARLRVQAGIDRDAGNLAVAQGIVDGAVSGATTYAAGGGFTKTPGKAPPLPKGTRTLPLGTSLDPLGRQV